VRAAPRDTWLRRLGIKGAAGLGHRKRGRDCRRHVPRRDQDVECLGERVGAGAIPAASFLDRCLRIAERTAQGHEGR